MSDTFTGETYNTLCNDSEGYLANESPEQARELLQKAISLIGTRPRARSLLADTCMSMELWSEARSQLEILITLDEGNTTNNFRLAQVLEELGEYQLALDNYSVVIDGEPDHHAAGVAVKRIEARTKDSGVNLADIFNSPKNNVSRETAIIGGTDIKDGLQVFPDVPSDELFADSEDDAEDSVDRLLKNIGFSDDSTEEEEENDVSQLLENIGVSTTQALQTAFENPVDSQEEGSLQPQEESEEAADAEVDMKKKSTTSLDEIFGMSSSSDEISEPEVEEPKVEEPEVEEPEVEEPEVEEPEVEEPEVKKSEEELSSFAFESEETDDTEDSPFSSSNTLEAIFNAPEPEQEAEAVEEEAEAEAEEPEQEEEAVEEEAEPEAEEPEQEEKADKLAVVAKYDADFSIDSWSPESGLLAVHIKSGTIRLKQSVLPVYEKSVKTEYVEDHSIELSGTGTFLLNCGSEKPLIVEAKENMVIRKDAVLFHSGTIRAELLDIPGNDSLYVVKDNIREKVVFKSDHPTRIILLGANNRVFYVRTSSIMATDPEILLSHSGSPEAYTEITGFGKVYLIE